MTPESFIETRWDRAQTAVKAKNWGLAEYDARTVAVLLPDAGRALMLCGMSMAPKGLVEQALTLLRWAHAASADDPLIQVRLCEALFAAGLFVEAEQAIRSAMRHDIPKGEAHFLLARVLWAQWRIIESQASLDIAVAHDPRIQPRRRILEHTAGPDDFLVERDVSVPGR